ncbi:hypothetical protein OSTOST_10658 [Ostertagia ostertagi]
MEAENMKEEDVLNFEEEVRSKLAHLEHLIADSKDSIMKALETRDTSPNRSHHEVINEHHQNGAKEIAQIRGEDSIIEDNVNFMEGVEELEEYEEESEEQDVDGEESEEEDHGAEDENFVEEVHGEDENEREEAVLESEDEESEENMSW